MVRPRRDSPKTLYSFGFNVHTRTSKRHHHRPYNEHHASLVLIHYDALVHTLQATAPAPPPFSPQPPLGTPFDLLPLSRMLAK